MAADSRNHDTSRALKYFTDLFQSHGLDPIKLATAIVWREQDQRVADFYSQFIKPGDLCFDIGACIGVRTKVFSRLGASVVTVEPQERCMKLLRAVYSLDQSVHLVHRAIAETTGPATLNACKIWEMSSLNDNWMSVHSKIGEDWDSYETVELTTLDSLIAEYGVPAFAKIDVEGSEYRVLQGLSHLLPCISIEYTMIGTALENTARCLDYLSRFGDLQLNYSVGESMTLSLPNWVDRSELLQELGELTESQTVGDVYVKTVTM